MEQLEKLDIKVLSKIKRDNLEEKKKLEKLTQNDSNKRKIEKLDEQNKLLDEEAANRIFKKFTDELKNEDQKLDECSDDFDEMESNNKKDGFDESCFYFNTEQPSSNSNSYFPQ